MNISPEELELAKAALAAGFVNAGLHRVQDYWAETYRIDEISRLTPVKSLYIISLENLIKRVEEARDS